MSALQRISEDAFSTDIYGGPEAMAKLMEEDDALAHAAAEAEAAERHAEAARRVTHKVARRKQTRLLLLSQPRSRPKCPLIRSRPAARRKWPSFVRSRPRKKNAARTPLASWRRKMPVARRLRQRHRKLDAPLHLGLTVVVKHSTAAARQPRKWLRGAPQRFAEMVPAAGNLAR